MKIDRFRTEICGDKTRIAAAVCWEDSAQPTRELYFETETQWVGAWRCNPEAFLVACVLPAWRHGEERIAIDGLVCPELRYGLQAALGLQNQWWLGHKPPRIEAHGDRQADQRADRHAGLVLSGGIDSLTCLRMNRLTYGREHPRAFQMGVFVHGFDIGFEEAQPQHDLYALACAALQPICQESGLTLVSLRTNVRHLDSDGTFWGDQFHGAALASVGHALNCRLRSLDIASGDNREMLPWGSHPALDPLYSSTDMQVRHEGVQYTRLEKTAIVAEWKTALDHLRVCYEATAAPLNCGRCEKCLRTMLHLLVCGKLTGCAAFPVSELTPAMLKPLRSISVNQEAYEILLEPLAIMGRQDLAAIVRDLRRIPRRRFVLKAQVRQFAVRLDRQLLQGRIARLRRTIKRASRHNEPA